MEAGPGAVIHTAFAIMNVLSIGGAGYFVTSTDEAHGHVRPFHMKAKGEAAELLECQLSWLEGQSGCMEMKIVLGGRGEFVKGLNELEACKFEFQLSAPCTPQKSGRAAQMISPVKNGIQILLI